jgi:hypothetical protein
MKFNLLEKSKNIEMAAEIGGKGKRCRSNSEIELTGLGD